MQAFLMNCPIDYYEDTSFEPVPVPTLAPSPATITHSRVPALDPSPEPTNIPIPMTHRSLHPNISLQGCVETRSHGRRVYLAPITSSRLAPITSSQVSSHGTKLPTPHRTISETPKKEVSWRDTLFPRHHADPTSSKS
jgi:hypothetical protein